MRAVGMLFSCCSLTPHVVWKNLRRDWLVSLGTPSDGGLSDSVLEGALDDSLDGGSLDLWAQVDVRRAQLEQYLGEHPLVISTMPKPARPMVLIAESDPVQFLAAFWAALLADWDIALANPRWGMQEWTTVYRLITPTMVWATNVSAQAVFNDCAPELPACSSEDFAKGAALNPESSRQDLASGLILIPTGGSSGQVKFVCHHWHSLVAAAAGFCDYFGSNQPVDACCVLPLYHVSGLMQAFRTFVSGGQLVLAGSIQNIDSVFERLGSEASPFISLVPTQLARLLQSGQFASLRQFKGVLLGGAPAWDDLLQRAAAERIPVCLSYGMTETAAMVTANALEAWPTGDAPTDEALGSSGRAMPHVQIRIERDGQCLPAGEVGQVVVRSPAVAQGYYGEDYGASAVAFASDTFYTDDLGYLDQRGHLHISGRISHKIISGGENIFPAEVEAALQDTQQVSDVYVLGLPDAEWGEVVTAVYVPMDDTVSVASLKAALAAATEDRPQLSHYKHPKRWIALSQLPRNAQGKLNRSALLALL